MARAKKVSHQAPPFPVSVYAKKRRDSVTFIVFAEILPQP
jgi:hypothetical protein